MGDFVQLAGSVSAAETRVRIPRGIRPLVAGALGFQITGEAFVA
jgi:hypothetical protein